MSGEKNIGSVAAEADPLLHVCPRHPTVALWNEPAAARIVAASA